MPTEKLDCSKCPLYDSCVTMVVKLSDTLGMDVVLECCPMVIK